MKRIAALVLALALFFSCASAAQAGNTRETKGYIALTFDDGPRAKSRSSFWTGLRSGTSTRRFFLCGYRIAQYPELAQRMAEDGHELGLHSDRHDYMQHMTKQEALEDLTECMGKLTEATGVTARLFRPPGGLYSADLLEASKELGLSVIFWSVDPTTGEKPSRTGAAIPAFPHAGGRYRPDARSDGALPFRARCPSSTRCARRVLNSALFPSLPPFPAQSLSPGVYYNRFPH